MITPQNQMIDILRKTKRKRFSTITTASEMPRSLIKKDAWALLDDVLVILYGLGLLVLIDADR